MDNKTCPLCGYTARALCSQDGMYWKYICERCKHTFIVKT